MKFVVLKNKHIFFDIYVYNYVSNTVQTDGLAVVIL